MELRIRGREIRGKNQLKLFSFEPERLSADRTRKLEKERIVKTYLVVWVDL